MSGWIAFTVVATAIIGMITAGIHAYTKWLELQIARSKSDNPQSANDKAQSKRDRVRWFLCMVGLAQIVCVSWVLISSGVTRVSMFVVFMGSVAVSFQLTVLSIMRIVDVFLTPKTPSRKPPP